MEPKTGTFGNLEDLQFSLGESDTEISSRKDDRREKEDLSTETVKSTKVETRDESQSFDENSAQIVNCVFSHKGDKNGVFYHLGDHSCDSAFPIF